MAPKTPENTKKIWKTQIKWVKAELFSDFPEKSRIVKTPSGAIAGEGKILLHDAFLELGQLIRIVNAISLLCNLL